MDLDAAVVAAHAQQLLDADAMRRTMNSKSHCAEDWRYDMRRSMQELIPGLFLGSLSSANDSAQLSAAGITHAVLIRSPEERHFVREKFPENILYHVVEVYDHPTQTLIPFFAGVGCLIYQVLREGGRVILYSTHGISRAPSFAVAFLMEYSTLSSEEALSFVQSKRYCSNPNYGFRVQLREYQPIARARATIARLQLQHPMGQSGDSSRPNRRKAEDDDLDQTCSPMRKVRHRDEMDD